LEPNHQPNHPGRVTQPREVEIVIRREAEQEQAALLEQLEQQQRQERQQQEQQAPGPPPLLGEDTQPVLRVKAGTPPSVVTEEQLAPPAPAQPERSLRARKPPRYLADYPVGHMEVFPQRSSTPNTGKSSEPQLQNSPGSTGLLQRRQPPDQHSHLDNRYPALSGNVGQSRWQYTIPMTDLDPPPEKEDEALTLLPVQLIGDRATTATTQPLRVVLARLGKEPGAPGSQIEEKIQPTHSQLPCHRQSMAPPYRECVLDSAIQAWSDILDRCTEEIESLVHHLQ